MSPAKPEAVKRRNSRPRRWAGVAGGGDVADKVTRGKARRQLGAHSKLRAVSRLCRVGERGRGPPTLSVADAACDVVASELAPRGVRKSCAPISFAPSR